MRLDQQLGIGVVLDADGLVVFTTLWPARSAITSLTSAALITLSAWTLAGCASSAGESATATNQATAAAVWDKTFPKNDKVDVEKVTFDNRLGIKLVGDLYVPKNIDRSSDTPRSSWVTRTAV